MCRASYTRAGQWHAAVGGGDPLFLCVFQRLLASFVIFTLCMAGTDLRGQRRRGHLRLRAGLRCGIGASESSARQRTPAGQLALLRHRRCAPGPRRAGRRRFLTGCQNMLNRRLRVAQIATSMGASRDLARRDAAKPWGVASSRRRKSPSGSAGDTERYPLPRG